MFEASARIQRYNQVTGSRDTDAGMQNAEEQEETPWLVAEAAHLTSYVAAAHIHMDTTSTDTLEADQRISRYFASSPCHHGHVIVLVLSEAASHEIIALIIISPNFKVEVLMTFASHVRPNVLHAQGHPTLRE